MIERFKKKKRIYEIFKEIIIQHDGRKINQNRESSKQVGCRVLTFVAVMSVHIGRLNSKDNRELNRLATPAI